MQPTESPEQTTQLEQNTMQRDARGAAKEMKGEIVNADVTEQCDDNENRYLREKQSIVKNRILGQEDRASIGRGIIEQGPIRKQNNRCGTWGDLICVHAVVVHRLVEVVLLLIVFRVLYSRHRRLVLDLE